MATASSDSEDAGEGTSATDGALDDAYIALLARWYHVPVLLGVMVFMFWTRFQNYSVFTRDGEGFWLIAIDSWYHWRTTEWTVANFPWRMGYDPWTGFPDGTLPGQFGTLFDQLVAAVAMGIGLGSPGEQDILMAALITVPALAALVALPTYYIGKRIGNRAGAIAGVIFLALTTGTFFGRSLAGMFQHHSAEVLFMGIAVLAMMVALTVGEREKPIWELVVEGNWSAVREPTFYSVLAGIALSLYIWVWPPGIVLIGIFGVFFVIQLSVDFVRGTSPDHLAFVGVVSMVTTAIGTAIRIQTTGFSATGLDFFPPVFALAVAGGCGFLAGLARLWEGYDLDPTWYPGAVAASIVASLVVMAIVLPEFVSTLVGNISGRILPFGYSPGAQTVAEVQPPRNISQFMYREYGMAFFIAFLAYPLLLFRPLFGLEQRGEHLLIVIWTLFLFSMAITQVRFNYYFVVAVAVLNAHLVAVVVEWMAIGEGVDTLAEYAQEIDPYHVAIATILVMMLFMPLLPPLADHTPVSAGSETYPTGTIQAWEDAPKWEAGNQWLAENTPEVGNYGGADNADELDFHGSYDSPPDGSFDYPEGAYGVLSWWDYGHFISVQANRIPHSNPFQQNVESSAAFLTAQNESQAELYLDAIAAGESPDHESDQEELRETVDEADLGPGIQYVMIDDESVAEKFPAITRWTGPDYEAYLQPDQLTMEGQEEGQRVQTAGALEDTMISRLYLDDAEGLEHYRLIHEIPTYSIIGFAFDGTRISQPYDLGTWSDNETVLQNQLDQARADNRLLPGLEVYDAHLASSLKIFERVEGATLTGESEPNAVVTATLTLQAPTERIFQYRQTTETDDTGAFSLTVPYPTAETLGPEDGYADSAVVPPADAGGYDLTVQTDEGVVATAENVSVPETAVQMGEDVPVTVEAVPEENAEEGNGDEGDTAG